METYISALPNLSTRLSCYLFTVGPSISAAPYRACASPGRIASVHRFATALLLAGPPTPKTARYLTFAVFGPFIIFVAAAARTGAATGAMARP